MNTEQFYDALNQIEDRYLNEAINASAGKRVRWKWLEIAACLCIFLALASALVYGLLPKPELPPIVVVPSTEDTSTEPSATESTAPSTEPITTTEPPTTEPPTVTEPPTTEPSTETEPPVSSMTTEPSTTDIWDDPPSLPVLPSMICVHGTLYEWLPDQSVEASYWTELPFLGTIGSYCADYEYPYSHLEANEMLVGAEVYEDGERMILVYGSIVRIYVPYGS